MSDNEIMTKDFLEEELGLKKEFTETGILYYEFEQGKYFYTSLTTHDSFYFVDESLQAYGEGVFANGIISSKKTFKRLYL